jgi:uncharacterized protein (TIGR03435 family)
MGIGVRLSILTGLAALSWAQPAQTLEVASVKASQNGTGGSNLDSVRGRLTATNITVRELIRSAYGVRDYQIGRVPAWVDSARFDIAAKSVSGSNSLNDEKSLVRELLAERYQLATHQEARQMPVYWLIVAKGGPKLAPHNDAGPKLRGGCGRLVGRRVTTDAIATILSRQLDREVVNRTSLAGEYDMQLNFTPDAGPCGAPDDQGASIYTALQQQLGLKLEPAKGPVQFLVIDRVEKPAGN